MGLLFPLLCGCLAGAALSDGGVTLKTYTNKEVTARLTAASDHIGMKCLTACLSLRC